MSPIRYLDFDLRIQRTETGFCSQVLNSPAGEASSSCEGRIFTELELESYLLKLGPRRALRRVGSPESGAAKDLGGRLFDSTFRGEVRDCLRQSLARAEEQGACLRIRLRLKDAPELANYPWEYLYDRNVNWFVALSGEAPVVRHLDLPLAIRPLRMSLPIRVLLMISSPSGCPQLSHEREENLFNEAFGPLRQQGKVELTRLPDATLDTLDQWLARGEYHILHFIGHGAFDRQIDDGVLILEDAEKQQRWTTGEALGIHLRVHRTLRLAVLNACEGARGSPHDPFSGVAQSLAQQGLPAVIAMQFEITDAAAVDFSRGFYGALAEGYPVDAALSRARLVLHANDHGLEWGTPVLYLRSRDGVVFESEETKPSGVSPNPLPIVRACVRVFLSYSHDDKEHCDRVLALAQQLRRDGIDAELDQFHQDELLHWPRWCEDRMRPENSDYVLCVCSREYRDRVEGRAPADVGKGVFWEGTMLYNALYDQKGHNPRFIAVLLTHAEEAHVPQILNGYNRFRLSSFELTDPGSDYAGLYRLLSGQRGSRSSAQAQPKKLEPLPEKLRRTDFVKLKEVLIGEHERPRADQRQQEEQREPSEVERHQKEAHERARAEQAGLKAERREREEQERLQAEQHEQDERLEFARRQQQGQMRPAPAGPVEKLPRKSDLWIWLRSTPLKGRVAFLILLLVIVCAIYFFGFRPTEPKPIVAIEQLKALTKKTDEAFTNGDAATLAALYTDDAVLMNDKGPIYGREAIEKYWADFFKQYHFIYHLDMADQKSPHSLGTAGNEAWSNGEWAVTFQYNGGPPTQAKGYWFKVYRHQGDTWKTCADAGFKER
jgi:ketosteroid isomerase-like protein